MLDEFHQLATASDNIAIYETEGLRTTDLAFITVEAFLGEKSIKKNQTQELICSLMGKTLGPADLKNEIILKNLILNIPDETRDAIEETFKGVFIFVINVWNLSKYTSEDSLLDMVGVNLSFKTII